jgi:hypothetical protein
VWEWFEPLWENDEDDRTVAAAVRVGLYPAGMKKKGWWWRSLTAPPTPEQRAALWEAVPEHKAYEVIETKLLD